MPKKIHTNIITGFLGTGKTTAILHLLKHKPESQRWAVLVNEFGDVGIDGAVIKANNAETTEISIKEVPGGCMCCAAGLPMQVALNQLIQRSDPEYLLIEPSGLGHPREVLGILKQSVYQQILDLRATVTLVDARKIANIRYREHETFRQQLLVADCIVANKSDLYQGDSLKQLKSYLDGLGLSDTPLHCVEQAVINRDWLSATNQSVIKAEQHAHHSKQVFNENNSVLPECGYLKFENDQGEYFSCGWIFSEKFIFSAESLQSLLTAYSGERLKAVMRTDQGTLIFNSVDGVLTQTSSSQSPDSRIEMIFSIAPDVHSLQQQLLLAALDEDRY